MVRSKVTGIMSESARNQSITLSVQNHPHRPFLCHHRSSFPVDLGERLMTSTDSTCSLETFRRGHHAYETKPSVRTVRAKR